MEQTELLLFKKNAISKLQNEYNNKISILNNVLNNNIRFVQNKPFNQLNKQMKNYYINILIAKYRNDVAILTKQLNANIQYYNRFQPTKVNITNKKTALLIGINYTGTEHQLYGCINDVESVKTRLLNNGFLSNNITILTDLETNPNLKPTKNNILREFKQMLANSNPGDLLFLLYSGHGSYIIDKNGDEKDGYDEVIVPCDMQYILDDELKTIITQYLNDPNKTLFTMFDCCFSGTILDLKYQYLDSLNYDQYLENNKNSNTVGNVYMISGCTEHQTSADAFINNKSQGAMTWALLECLTTKCTWRELIKKMRDLLKISQYEQIPQFASGNFVDIDSNVFI
jgi:hypothetical protein